MMRDKNSWRFAGLRRLALGLGLPLLLLAGGAAAGAGDPAASPWFETEQGRVRLIAAATGTGAGTEPGDSLQLGLQFALAPGWKVYWRAPGDAGLPPTLAWDGSRNLAAAVTAWPAPQRFSAYGLETIGYEGEVVLPIAARLAAPGAPLDLHLALQYLTCKEICIPYEAQLGLALPGGGASAPEHAALIARYAAAVPGDGAASGLALRSAKLVAGKAPMLQLALAATAPLVAPDAFIDAPPGIGFAAPAVVRDGDGARLDIAVSGRPEAIAALRGHSLRVTAVDGARAVEASLPVGAGPPPRDLRLILVMMATALLGGFILNFMPCVLPVLSIKLLAVAAQLGRERAAIRRGFLASAAGILAGFLLLAFVMIALRSAGLAFGWGVQFQEPGFLLALVLVLALFAGNTAGLFEMPLPAVFGRLGVLGAGRGHLGDFAAGLFATLLATPCSAPFLGTAVGFALAGAPGDILAIFLALGLGLALPYLAVAAFPGLAARLPRPGRWMVTLRRLLALILAATALWLLSVLASQIGAPAAFVIAAALAAAAAALRWGATSARRWGGVAATLVVIAATPALLPRPAARAVVADGLWQRFDQPAIDRLVRSGKTVFVDVTADWCINCKVNERLVLGAPSVERRLAGPGIVAMRADWTRPDPAITGFLRDFGRYGIPFYAVFGPGCPEGEALAEILTPDAVLGALDEAEAPAPAPPLPLARGG